MVRSRALALLVAVALLTVTVTASAPPQRLCGTCGDGPIDGPDTEYRLERDAPAAVTVQVYANGSSRWSERVTFERDSARRLEANATLRERFVRDAFERHAYNDPEQFETSVDGRTLVTRYWVPDAAHTGVGGVLLFDHLYRPGWYIVLDADVMRIRGPPGTTVVNSPDAGRSDGAEAVFTGPYSALGGDTYVAFAESDGPIAGTAAGLTMALDVGPTMVAQALTYGLPVGAAWMLVAVALTWFVRGRRGLWLPESLASRLGRRAEVTPDPEATTAARRYLLAGTVALAAVPVGTLLVGHRPTVFATLVAVPLFWAALGVVQTPRQWWWAVGGLALLPSLAYFAATPLSGIGGLLLFFGLVAGLLWIPAGVAAFYFPWSSAEGA